jgi:hypothetical protein
MASIFGKVTSTYLMNTSNKQLHIRSYKLPLPVIPSRVDTPLVWLKFDTLSNSGSSGTTNNMTITDSTLTYNNPGPSVGTIPKYAITNGTTSGAGFGSLPFNYQSTFTVSFWGYFTAGNSSLLALAAGNQSNYNNCSLNFGNRQVQFWINTTQGLSSWDTRSTLLGTGYTYNKGPNYNSTWFHCAWVITPAGMTLYINGVSYGTLINNDNATTTLLNSSITSFPYNYLMVGANTGPSATSRISDFRIYNYDLTPTEVSTLYAL